MKWNAPSPRALLGSSAAILHLQEDARLAERSDAQVLITGERGVGKRALAVLIHTQSHRKGGAFRSISCAGLTDAVVEAKLFGEKAPSAEPPSRRVGLLQAARRGTLFINGIDQISQKLQARLSRFLEADRTAVARSDWEVVDVRIIVGAPPDLFDRVASGNFRPDLYYRLNVIHLIVPPLRQRLDDLPGLLRDCLAHYARRSGIEPPGVSSDAMAELLAYPWPGNLAELGEVARWLIERAGSGTITPRELPRWMVP